MNVIGAEMGIDSILERFLIATERIRGIQRRDLGQGSRCCTMYEQKIRVLV
jgi:hypothetical protein